MNDCHDPVEEYLDQLYASLRTTPREARRIIAEAEDHLRESVEAGLAAGLTERAAQEAAISSFGSVRAVVRAHARRVPPVTVLGELVMAAWKLGSIAPPPAAPPRVAGASAFPAPLPGLDLLFQRNLSLTLGGE